jgi:hypothetical protein
MVAAAAMVTQCRVLSRTQSALNRDLAVLLFARLLWLPVAAFALGACGTIDYESFRAPDLSVIAPKTMATLRETQLKPVSNEDLVDTEGRCSGVPFGPDPNLPSNLRQDNIPALPGAIGLDMTECDVVKRAGHPGRVEFGTNEHGERTVVLTYMSGQRPGIYSFASGRLKSVERVAEPQPPPKPQKRAPPKQRAAT